MIKDVSDSGAKKGGMPLHKKPYRKAPAHVVEERIEFVAELLARGCNSQTIRRELQKKPHSLSNRSIAEYVARAQDWLLKRAAGITKVQALAEAIAYYRQVIADTKTETRDKLDARKQLDLIFGLHAPRALAIREMPLPQTPADEMERQTNPGMEQALVLVYGPAALREVIEIETMRTKELAPLPPNPKKKTLKLE